MPIAENVVLGMDVRIHHPDLVNIYGCIIGDESRIGTFVEIQSGAVIGKRCKIQSHSFICEGVNIEDDVFVGHGVIFTNDLYPRATNSDGSMQGPDNWICLPTRVSRGASIGSNATILCNLTIGQGALIAAGAVVTTSVPDFALVVGIPARIVGDVRTGSKGLKP